MLINSTYNGPKLTRSVHIGTFVQVKFVRGQVDQTHLEHTGQPGYVKRYLITWKNTGKYFLVWYDPNQTKQHKITCTFHMRYSAATRTFNITRSSFTEFCQTSIDFWVWISNYCYIKLGNSINCPCPHFNCNSHKAPLKLRQRYIISHAKERNTTTMKVKDRRYLTHKRKWLQRDILNSHCAMSQWMHCPRRSRCPNLP